MSERGFDGLSRRALLRGAGLGAAGAALGSMPFAARAAATSRIERQWPAVTALVEGYVEKGVVSGMIAALGWGTRAPSYIARGREGFDDSDPDSPRSLFRAYSMTKPVTGMAAMILIEEGKLALDQPLADFAPEFAHMKVATDPQHSLDAVPAERQITIRHLLTHTAGLGYPALKDDAVSNELKRLGVNGGILSHQQVPGFIMTRPTPGPDEYLRLAASVPLLAQPGTRWSYAIGLDVLGIVIGRITGKGLDGFLAERIFKPLGMKNSFFRVPAGAERRLTTNYSLLDGKPEPIDVPGSSVYEEPTPFAFGGSGLVTTPADYDRFLAMIVNRGLGMDGRRVMSERAVALGTSNLMPEAAMPGGTYEPGGHFGAGGEVGTGRDEGLFGWSGAAGTIGYAQSRLGLRKGLWVQYMPSRALPVFDDFTTAVRTDLTAAGKERA